MRHLWFGLRLLTAMSLCSAPLLASAQDDPPRRLEGEAEPVHRRAAAEETREETSLLDRLHPSASLGLMLHMRPDLVVEQPASFPLWLGVRTHLTHTTWAPYITAGVMIDIHRRNPPTPQYIDLIPTLRLGVAKVPGEPTSWQNRTLAHGHFYATVGYRVASTSQEEGHGGILRVGIGASSPVIAAGALFACANGLPIPNLIEFAIDTNLATGERNPVLMVGIGL